MRIAIVYQIDIQKYSCVQTMLFFIYFFNLCHSLKNFTKFCYFSKQESITGYVTSADNTSSREKSIEIGSKHLKKVEKTDGLEEINSLTFEGLQSNAGSMPSVLLGSSKKNGKMQIWNQEPPTHFPLTM